MSKKRPQTCHLITTNNTLSDSSNLANRRSTQSTANSHAIRAQHRRPLTCPARNHRQDGSGMAVKQPLRNREPVHHSDYGSGNSRTAGELPRVKVKTQLQSNRPRSQNNSRSLRLPCRPTNAESTTSSTTKLPESPLSSTKSPESPLSFTKLPESPLSSTRSKSAISWRKV